MKSIKLMALGLITLLYVQQTQAQRGEVVTSSNFEITFSDEVYSLVAPNATMSNITDGYSDVAKAMEAGGEEEYLKNNPAAYFDFQVKDQITKYTMAAFQEKLNIEVKPLSALAGKVEYSGGYPSEAKIKKAVADAPGEQWYFSYSVYMYKGGVAVGPADVALGGKLKPTTAITLQIADADGKVVQEFEIKEKTDIAIGKMKANLGDVQVGKGMDPDELVANVMKVYEESFAVLLDNYLKENKKDYKL